MPRGLLLLVENTSVLISVWFRKYVRSFMLLGPNFACNGRRSAAVLGHFKATTEESFSLTRTKPHSLQNRVNHVESSTHLYLVNSLCK